VRIAFFTETFLPATDGVVTRLRHTIEELLGMGDEMLVIAPKYGEGPGSYEGVPIHRVSSVPFPPYPQIKLAPINPGVGTALRGFGPELIHAVNPFVLGRGTPFYSRRLDVPLVASYHTNIAAYARFYGLGLFDRATRWYTRKLHNTAAINLCTSEATLRYLADEGVERLHLWPQGVDARRFHPDKFSKDWRVRLTSGHPAERLLLYVGRLAHEKNIGNLRVVLGEVPGVRLALVGDGPARRDLEEEYANTRTVFTGVLQGEELAAAFASADAFLFPSTTETLGIAPPGCPCSPPGRGRPERWWTKARQDFSTILVPTQLSSPPSERLSRTMACAHGWDVTPARPRRGAIGELRRARCADTTNRRWWRDE
jgi:glycosyltransferase involved in cell wall biosynthesis